MKLRSKHYCETKRADGPLRVLCYLPTPRGLTGAPRRLLTLCHALKRLGFEPVLVVEDGTELSAAAKAQGVEILHLPTVCVLRKQHGAMLQGRFWEKLLVVIALVLQNLRFLAAVRRTRADAVVIRASKGFAFSGSGAFLSGKPIVWDVDYEPLSRGIIRWLHKFGLRVSSAVVFQYSAAGSNIFGSKLAARYARKFYALVPGIDLGRIGAKNKKNSADLSMKNRPFKLLQIGTICDRKNQALSIDALHLALQKVGDRPVVLQLAGGVFEECYAEYLVHRVSQLGLNHRVEFLGWRDDVDVLIRNADLLLMPSKEEGVPNTVQEAMFLGLPVVASDAGGLPEVIDHERTGWIVPLHDIEGWANRIAACIQDPSLCRLAGRAASAYAAAHFGTESWASRYAKVINSVARRPTPSLIKESI